MPRANSVAPRYVAGYCGQRHRSASVPIWKYVAAFGATALLAAAIFFAWGKWPLPISIESTPTPTMIPVKTPTKQPTATPTVRPTNTPKVTPTPKITPMDIPTVTPSPIATVVPTATPKPRPPSVSVRKIVFKGENGAVIPLLDEKCLVKPGERIIVTFKDASESEEEVTVELSAAGQGRIEGNTYIAPEKPGAVVPLTIRIMWKCTGEQLASKGIIVKTQREK